MQPERDLDIIRSQERIITKLRVVVGLLGEIDASDTLVMFSPKSDGEHGNVQFTAKVMCEFNVPFETSIFKIIERVTVPGLYNASAFFAGQRVTFELTILDEAGTCSLPKEINIIDLRLSKRRRFGPEIEYAEISTSNGVLMATPIDMNQNAIALVMNSRDGFLNNGELVRLVIRGDTTSRDIFSAEMQVQDFKVISGRGRILLTVDQNKKKSGHGRPRSVKRQDLKEMSVLLSPADDYLGEPIRLQLVNVSLTGFQVLINHPRSLPWLTQGISVQVLDGAITATVAWCEADRVGLRLNSLDDPNCLSEWAKILSSFRIGSGFHHSHAEELVSLFTESGLLKGKRRLLYGNSPKGYLPPDRMTENPLLYRRIQATSSQGKIIGQMSIGRMADDLWYFQEGAHTGGDGPSFRDLYSSVIALTKDLHSSSRLSPRYLSGLYHENIKSAGAFGIELFADPSSRVYPLYQCSIEDNLSNFSEQILPEVSVLRVSDYNADERRHHLVNFDATLVEAFVGWNGDHPRLNSELAKLGNHHRAETLLLASQPKGVWGMAYRLRSYYALNATGVMNSLFIVVKPSVSGLEIASGFRELRKHGLAFGTDDAALIVDTGINSVVPLASELLKVRPFTFFILDNHLNREHMGGPVERPESISLRVKKNPADD
jgi:hypothetical protein